MKALKETMALVGALSMVTGPLAFASGVDGIPSEESQCVAEPVGETPPLPVMESNGAITLRFGDGLPKIVCAPLQVCDIELQMGESIKGANLGDSVRWEASPAVSGSEGSEVPHVVIKPKSRDVGAATSLVVTTDRRTYHFALSLSGTQYMPRVLFSYPDSEDNSWTLYRARQELIKKQARRKAPRIEQEEQQKKAGSVESIDFSYDIEGKAAWKPLRVYNDGKHTYIDFPAESFYADIPVLLSVSGEGAEELINYRVKNSQFKVDGVLSEGILVSGVGSEQSRVAISRRKKDA